MLIFALNFVGKRIKTNPQTLDFTRLFRFVLIILYSHTYISKLIEAEVDPKTVQYLAGHENSRITMDIYTHLRSNRPEDLMARVSKAFVTE